MYAFADSKTDAEAPHANGAPNGYARVDHRVRDAEEFELEGLTDDEDDDDEARLKEGRTNGHLAI